MKSRVLLLCGGLLLSGLFAFTQAMPPHPDLLSAIADGRQTAPYYLQHRSELLARGVDNPPEMRTVQELLRRNPLDENFRILFIFVDFSDNVAVTPGSSYDNLFFGNQTGSLKHYYSEVTYGDLTLLTVNLPSSMGWERMPQTYAYYVNGQNGFGSYPQNAQRMVEDAVNAVDPIVDFSQYDNDGNGYVDGLFVVHAGRGAEYTGGSNNIWSHAWATHTPQHLDGVWVYQYSMEPEFWASSGDMTCGVFAHEMGHSVFGLPDLYDTDYSSSGLGRWSLMAGGSWNGSLGNSPAHPDAYCKIRMGVVTPTVVASNQTSVSVPNAENNPTAFRLWTNGGGGNQYFLVENRQRTGYDTGLPSSGMLIYHVDNIMPGNDNEWYPGMSPAMHYKVALEQADGDWNLEHDANSGDSGDPYPGSTNNHTFDNTSTPNSQSYAPANTDVAVRNISASASTMTADLIVTGCTAPPQVTGLTATTDRCTDVQLNWTDVVAASGYKVYRNGTQIGGDLPAHTVTYTDASGIAGTAYNYTVAAFSGACVGPASTAASGARLASPAQVTGVSASGNRCSDVLIQWTDVANEIGYRVFRGGTQIGGDLAANATSYTDATASPGTNYSYTVRAFGSNCAGAVSSPATGLRLVTPPQVTNVSATTTRCSDIQVTWSDVSGEGGYRVYRNGVQIGGNLSPNTVIYTDAGASVGVEYSYTVLAYNGSCLSELSAAVVGIRASVPAQVTNVSATTGGCATVQISWTAVTGATGYRVYRNGNAIGDVSAPATTYDDGTGNPGTTYTYTVAALNGSCVGPVSAGHVGLRYGLPATVASVVASRNRCSDIYVTWADQSGEAGYRVYRNGTLISGNLSPNTTGYHDAQATAGLDYAYNVTAFNGTCESAMSSTESGFRLVTPARVSGVIASTDRCTGVEITWNAVASASGYRLFRDGVQLGGDLSSDTTHFVDLTAVSGITYSYTVLAFNGECVGMQSAAASGQRTASPPPVTGLTASQNQCSGIQVTWQDASGETGYRVLREGVVIAGNLAAGTTSYTDNSAAAGQTYSYTLQAFSGQCMGSLSAPVTGYRAVSPAQVSNVSATQTHCADVLITWQDLSGETGYRVYRDGVIIAGSLTAGTTSYADISAAVGQFYSYTVQAYNTNCSGSQSAPAVGMRMDTPTQVANVVASSNRCTDVLIAWADNDAANFRVLRDGAIIADNLSAHTINYADGSATPGIAHSYTVIAFNGTCASSPSLAATGLRLMPLGTVPDVTASDDLCSGITLSWNDVSGADSFQIRRDGTAIGTVSGSIHTFNDLSAAPGLHAYRVIAQNACGLGDSGNTAEGIRLSQPLSVSQVTATTNHCTDILLNWLPVADVLGYVIIRNEDSIAVAGSSENSYSDVSAMPGENISYAVRAYNICGSAADSPPSIGFRMTVPSAVSEVTASTDRCDSIVVIWDAVADAVEYTVSQDGVDITVVTAPVTRLALEPAIGSHSYVIVAENTCGSSLPSATAVGTRWEESGQPGSVMASDTVCGQIIISWNAASGRCDYYQILRDGVQIDQITALSYTDNITGQHDYQIRAGNIYCGTGLLSVLATGFGPNQLPAVVALLASDNSCSAIALTWDALADAASYVIYRDNDSIGVAGTNQFTDSAAAPGVHDFVVRAVNTCGLGQSCLPVTGHRLTVPDSVHNVTATETDCAGIIIAWSDLADETGYAVFRNGVVLAEVNVDETGFADTTALAGIIYNYAVRAINNCGDGALSAEATGFRFPLPGAVYDVTATADRCDSVIVMWIPERGGSAFQIFRDGEIIAEAGENDFRFADTPVFGSHSYAVRATNLCGIGELSESAVGGRLDSVSIPGNLTASDTLCDHVELSWSAAVGVTDYELRRDGVTIATVPASATHYADTLAAGEYVYAIRAVGACGVSEWSVERQGVCHATPNVPPEFSLAGPTCEQVGLSWTPSRGAPEYYMIYRDGLVLDSTFALAYTDTSLHAPGMHVYHVTARDPYCGEGPATEPISTGLLPLTQVVSSWSDTVHALDTLTIDLTHCGNAESDSIFLSLNAGAYTFVVSYAPVRGIVTIIVPALDSLNTPDCRIMVLSNDGGRQDTLVSPSFVIHSPVPDVVDDPLNRLPQKLVLRQNVPNPFNPSTEIRFDLPASAHVELKIFNVLGREVATLMNEVRPAGSYSIIWDSSNAAGAPVPSGMYVYQLRAGERTDTKKMVLLR